MSFYFSCLIHVIIIGCGGHWCSDVFTALQTTLNHLEQQGTYAYASFLWIIAHLCKLLDQGPPYHTCLLIKGFLTGCRQKVWAGPHTFTPISLSTVRHHSRMCAKSFALHILYVQLHNCSQQQHHRLICIWYNHNSGDLTFQDKMKWLSLRCMDNNMLLNAANAEKLVIELQLITTRTIILWS